MGASVGGNKGFVAEINVTPFVDVMLVLLIIFMVTAPMMTEGLDVELPRAEAVEALPTDADYALISIGRDGAIRLDNYDTPPDLLTAQLVTVVKNPNRQLFMKADKDVPYGRVVEVLGYIKAAGIDKYSIVAERMETPLPGASGGPAAPAVPQRGGR